MIPGIFKHPTEKLLIINKITQKLPLEVIDIIKKHLYYVKNSLPSESKLGEYLSILINEVSLRVN